MNFRNILWRYSIRKDGRCDLKVYFSHEGRKKYLSSDIKILPEDWDEQKQEVKKSHPLHSRYNAKLKKIRLDIERHFLDGGNWNNLFNKKENTPLIDFFAQIIEEGNKGLLNLKPNTLKGYKSTMNRLKEYKRSSGKSVSLSEFDASFYNDFLSFLADKCKCKAPGISKHIKILKRVMNIGLERGVHSNKSHNDSGLKRVRESNSSKIFLTEDEISILETADLSSRSFLQRELDRFLIAYHFIMRYSDVIKINKDDLTQRNGKSYLRYRSEKTNNEIIIPVKSRALQLLEKYDFNIDFGSNQQANRNIKTAISAAGINHQINVDGIIGPKSQFVTMHTARRSAATNLYLSGEFSIKTIADLGGWKSIKVLQVYLRCSNMDSAMMAAESDFFK